MRRGLKVGGIGSGIDRDARLFAIAAKLTNTSHITATHSLVIGTKVASIWSLIEALYPFVGGDDLSHSKNLKNPNQYNMTWAGSLTHSALGVRGDGTTGYGDTGFTATSQLETIGIYVVSVFGLQDVVDIGVIGSAAANGRNLLHFAHPFENRRFGDMGNHTIPGSRLTVVAGSTPAAGLLAQSRIGANQGLYLNGASIAASTNASNTSVPSSTTFKLAASSAQDSLKSSRQFGAAFIAKPLTAGQHSSLYDRVQAFQTALGRAV